MVAQPHEPDAFDWQRGRWQRRTTDQAAASIVITADWAPIRRFADAIANDPPSVYGDLLPVLETADLRITNLECPLTDRDVPVSKSGSELRGHPVHIAGLTCAHFDVVTLGNNHVLDYGFDAFAETTRLLDRHGIRWVGAGMTPERAYAPLVIDANGIRVGIVNFSEGEDLTDAVNGPGVFGWDVERAAAIVSALRRQVHVVLVICHCGVEYIAFPPPYVVSAFRRMVDAGADLVIGHHPHVPQGIDLVKGVPICYSLGNFVFFQETDLLFRKVGYAVAAALSPEGVDSLSLIPYEIRDDGLAQMDGGTRRWFLGMLERVSSPLGQMEQVHAAWHGFLSRYGTEGFKKEIALLMRELNERPSKGAAMFRNRVTTMQHRQHWIDVLTRIMEGTIDEAPDWARELNRLWLTETR